MTAHTVIVAETKIGFLTGGQRASFHALPQEEQDIQLEEAYGRATVALTRARSLCVIMGPLDMKGLLGRGYCHWIAYVWGWPCVQGSSQLLSARGLLSEFST